MGDENPIRTLGDYSKPSHEGYRNTIELPVGNNVQEPSPHGWIYYSRSFLNLFPTGRIAKLRNRKSHDLNEFRVHQLPFKGGAPSKEDEAKEEDGEKSTATDCKGHETTDEMEDKVESEEEVEEETEEEAEEEEEGNPKHFDTFPL
ncbi:hypothetical protein Tco_1295184 [Tanacetum coccineum]